MTPASPRWTSDALRALDAAGLRRRVRTAAGPGPRTTVDGRAVVSFASNDYLGLAGDARLAAALARAAAEEGTGAGAARLLAGSRPSHDALEADVAAFLGAEAALLFGSGWAANASLVPALFGPGDLVVSDRLVHGSLVDGCRLSGAAIAVVPHADPDAVRAALGRGGFRRRGVLTEGLFSMEGRSPPLAALAAAAAERDALLVVDEAHACGVLGPNGRGAAAAAGLGPGPGLVIMGTFGKAFGGFGAFVAWTADGVELLRQRARGFLFSTALPPGIAAADREGLRIARAEPERRARAAARARALREAVGPRAGGDREAPLVPILLGEPAAAVAAADALLARGLWVPAVRPPTVPAGGSRLRIGISAAHEPADVAALAAALAEVLRG
jgi:8-amino-7-oxononanoate synthase